MPQPVRVLHRTMRAAFITEYGDPDVLQVGDLPDPVPGPDGVVVRVHAAGVNPVDTKVRAGHLDGAFPTAFPLVPGWDVAGVVEAVGPAVREYTAGDRVLGYVRKDHVQHGAAAELVRADVRHLAPLPDGASFEAAGGLPLAGLTARQVLDAVGVDRGDTVLVHAAAGGVGSFAVQLAVARGARVVGTASEANHDHLRSLGAEPVTYGDGLAERVRELGEVDAAVDLVGLDAVEVSFDLVRDPARVATVIDPASVLERGGRYVFVRPDPAQLGELATMLADGRLQVSVRSLPLSDVAEAHRQSETGHGRGKVVLVP